MKSFKIILVCSILSTYSLIIAQTTEVFTSTNSSWIVPAGVTSIDVEAYGAGAGGQNNKGIGGGGGAYVSTTITVTSGNTLSITVPAGGGPAADGSDATVQQGASTLVQADGGYTNGGGGIITQNIPVSTGANGGAGGAPNKNAGGGGGASGSSAGDGANGASNKNGGAGGLGVAGGGSGGDGGVDGANGLAGGVPGGGGGGGGKNGTGGAGGRAQVEFTYTISLFADMGIVKTVDKDTVLRGDTITFTLTAENFGPNNASSAEVSDVLSGDLTYISHLGGAYNSITGLWNIGSLNVGSSEVLTITARVNFDASGPALNNTASITSELPEPVGASNPNNDNTTTYLREVNADLGLLKSANQDTVNIGDTVVYTLIAQHYGPEDLIYTTVSDVLSLGLSYISHTSTKGTYNSVSGDWTIGAFSSGDIDTLLITALVTYDAASATLTNNAFIASEATEPIGGNSNNASATIYIRTTDLRLTKIIIGNPTDAFEGDTLEYRLQLRNLSADTATSIIVYDTLPPGVTFVAITNIPPNANVSYSAGVVTYEKFLLEPLVNRAVRYTVIVNPGTAGSSITNYAEIGNMDQFDTNLNNNNNSYSINIITPAADIGLLKSIINPSALTQGDTVSFSIQAYNDGPGNASIVEINEYLPSNLDFLSYSASVGSYSVIDGFWSGVSINAGDTATLTLTTYIKRGGDFKNIIEIKSANVVDNNPDNNRAEVSLNALKTYSPGACIINLGQTPQTSNNSLTTYGLLWTLVKEDLVPVDWAINPNKSFVSGSSKVDQVDFSVNGVDYSSGAFIIDELFVPDAQATLDKWLADYPQLEVNCNLPEFTVPIHSTISSFPKAVLDFANGDIVETIFYSNIGIDNVIIGTAPNGDDVYTLYRPNGLPSNLGVCDDIYAMPHADPHLDWDVVDIETFDAFIKNGGFFFAGCHAVSALETYMDIPSIPGGAPQMNYLSVGGLIPWDDAARANTDGTPPYIYEIDTTGGQYYPSIASDPIMQHIGEVSNALSGGSEEIYVPYAAGWRSTTTIAVYDPDHPDIVPGGSHPTNAAAAVAYGHAFGNPDYGFIVYEGSHNFEGGTPAEDNAAARVYGNLWTQAGIDFRPEIILTDLPQEIIGGVDAVFSVKYDPNLNYEWFAGCGGTFSNPDSSWTRFTPPLQVDTPIRCIMRLSVYDDCNRTNFQAEPYFVFPYADIEVVKTTAEDSVTAGDEINYTIRIENFGPSPSTGLIIRDVLPSGTAVIGNTPSIGSWEAPDWIVGTIDPTDVHTLDLVIKTDSQIATGNITNLAFVKSLSIDTVQTNDTSFAVTWVNNPFTLPVELIQLDAYAYGNDRIEVHWATVTEINNAGFELQRSTDGIVFEEIAWLDGQGNSSILNEYYHSDYYVEKDIVYYYRLKQIDYDDHFEYSDIVYAKLAENDNENQASALLIPNPCKENGIIKIQSNINENIQISVINMYGVTVDYYQFVSTSKRSLINMDLSDLNRGVYNVLIQMGNGNENTLIKKWVKL